MRNDWRIGVLLIIAVSVAGTTARGQAGGTAAGVPVGADSNGNVSTPAQGDDAINDPAVPPVEKPKPARVSPFHRVTTTRRDVVPAPAPAARVAGPGAASGKPSGALSSATATRSATAANTLAPYSSQPAAQAGGKVVRERVPASSSWYQGSQRALNPPPIVRSSAHSYYPGMRPAQSLNANAPRGARSTQRRTGSSAGILPGLGVLPGLGASAARIAPRSPTSSPGQPSSVGAPRR